MGRLKQKITLNRDNEQDNVMNKDINTLINELREADIAEEKQREERLEKIFNDIVRDLK